MEGLEGWEEQKGNSGGRHRHSMDAEALYCLVRIINFMTTNEAVGRASVTKASVQCVRGTLPIHLLFYTGGSGPCGQLALLPQWITGVRQGDLALLDIASLAACGSSAYFFASVCAVVLFQLRYTIPAFRYAA